MIFHSYSMFNYQRATAADLVIHQADILCVQKHTASSCRAVDFLVPEIHSAWAGTSCNQLLANLINGKSWGPCKGLATYLWPVGLFQGYLLHPQSSI